MLKQKKGFGGAVSTLIMFIAIISVTTGLVIAFMNYVNETQHSFDKKNDLSSKRLRTSITITNTYYNSTSDDLYIYVKNIGETELVPDLLDLFVNKDFEKDFMTVYPDDFSKNKTILQPQESVVVINNVNITSGTHEVKVVTQYGVGDTEQFNI